MVVLNREVLERIYTLPDEYAFTFLESISSGLYSTQSDIGNFKLNRSDTLDKIRAKIKEHGTDDIDHLSKEITRILKLNITKTKKHQSSEVENTATKAKVEINELAIKKVNSIEQSKWLTPIESEALMRAEDPAYPTPNLNDMRENAKWQFFHLACAKVRILKALNVEV